MKSTLENKTVLLKNKFKENEKENLNAADYCVWQPSNFFGLY
jgi:3-deoxy-D-arabino-heptulosonate 7-phosphate (DAHP) synthase